MDHKKHYQTIANSLAACLQLRIKDFPKPVGNIPSSTHLAWDCYWITYEKHLIISPQISQTGANFPLALRVLYVVLT